MKATVVYLLDGLVQRKTFKGKRIVTHIHADPGAYKRGYVRVGRTEYFYSSVVEIIRKRPR